MRDDVVFFPNKSFDVNKRSGCLMELDMPMSWQEYVACVCVFFVCVFSRTSEIILGIGVCLLPFRL